MKKTLQHHWLILSMVAFAAAILFSSCSNMPKETKYIPKDAGFILGIDAKRMEDKINWDSIKNSSLYHHLLSETKDSTLRAILIDPAQTGIDLQSHPYFFFKQDKRFGTGFGGGVISLDDAAKFENLLKKNIPGATIKKENDLSWITDGDDFVIGWNKDIAILLGAMNDNDFRHHFNMNDTAGNNDQEPKISITDEMKTLFHLSKSDAAASLSPFIDLQKKNADVTVWANMEQVYKNISFAGNPMMSMLIKPEWYENYYMSFATDFEDGKIVTDIDAHVNDKVAAIGKNLFDKSINTSLIKNIPSDSLAGVMAVAFKPEGLKDVLTMMGVDGLANAALSQQGLTTDDILKAFKGDMVVAVSDLKRNNEMMQTPTGNMNAMQIHEPSMNWLFSMTIGDAASMNKLLDMGAQSGFLQKNGNSYSLTDTSSNIGFVKNDKLLTVASSKNLALQYSQGNASSTANNEIADIMNGKYFGLYVNFNVIANAFAHKNADSSQSYDNVLKGLMKDMYITSDKFSDNNMHSSMVFRYNNSKENSLQQLINAGEKLFEVYQNKKDNPMQIDSTAAMGNIDQKMTDSVNNAH